MDAIQKLVYFIENPGTESAEREKAISELNLLGKASAEIENEAYNYWHGYFSEQMEEVLSEKIVVVSHLLSEEKINACFQEAFEEFAALKSSQRLTKTQKFGYEGF